MSDRPRKRFNRRRLLIIIGVVVLIAVCAGGGYYAFRNAQQAAQQALASGWTTATAERGSIDASVNATGEVEAAAEAEVRFSVSGTVQEIYVKPGDEVEAGQPLARIDDADLLIALESAQADLKQAQADQQQLLDGATPEDIAQAEAQLAQARGSLQQTLGSVTQSDIAAARARLDQAQAELARVQSGPKETDLRSVQADVEQAQTSLQSQRDSLSAAKTNAKLQLDQAVNQLTQTQASYATAKANWDYVQETGKDPVNPNTVDPQTGEKVANKVNDQQRQQYYNMFVQAESSLRSAEAAVEQAEVNYDNARQAEVSGVQAAEQQLTKAQAQLEDLTNGADPDQLAAARAAVQSAQADLAKLTGANRSGSVEAARAGVTSAEAALDKLRADPSTTSLAIAEANVARAQASIQRAQRDLDRATLKAPFAGTVARVGLRVGEGASGAASAASTDTSSGSIVITDLSGFHVDVPVDELDVARIDEGQAANIILDALPDEELTGTVANIEPLATKTQQGTTNYQVTIDIDAHNAGLLPGMTATVEIITVQKDDVVLVPRRAIQTEDGQNVVLIPTGGPPDPQTGRPASEVRAVQLGLSNDEYVEIVSGLEAGTEVLVPDVVNTFNPVGQ